MKLMKRITGGIICAAMALMVAGMTLLFPETAGAEKLNIITTTADLASIATAVAGDHADVESIADGRRDPHFLQAKPGHILKARDADLWIRVGMELEIGWEDPVLRGSRNPRIQPGAIGHLDASRDIIARDIPRERISRAMGDVHPMGNPHYWLDPLNGRIITNAIADRLMRIDPQNAEDYEKNRDAFIRQIDVGMFGKKAVDVFSGDRLWAMHLNKTLDDYLRGHPEAVELGGWIARMRPHEQTSIVIHHRSWNYFSARFGLDIVAELEPKPGIPPSSAHLADVEGIVREKGAPIILVEPYYSRKPADHVADRTNATVIVCANSVGGEPEAVDYVSLIDLIVERISAALSEKGS
jgi:zinc/manganese transport system substrate-binding protein